eukprot:COSAG03_NODE_117_length_12378_cov_17.137448_3_plen_177_part_00
MARNQSRCVNIGMILDEFATQKFIQSPESAPQFDRKERPDAKLKEHAKYYCKRPWPRPLPLVASRAAASSFAISWMTKPRPITTPMPPRAFHPGSASPCVFPVGRSTSNMCIHSAFSQLHRDDAPAMLLDYIAVCVLVAIKQVERLSDCSLASHAPGPRMTRIHDRTAVATGCSAV